MQEFGAAASPINFLPAEQIIKNVEVKGPGQGEALDKIKELQRRYHSGK